MTRTDASQALDGTTAPTYYNDVATIAATSAYTRGPACLLPSSRCSNAGYVPHTTNDNYGILH